MGNKFTPDGTWMESGAGIKPWSAVQQTGALTDEPCRVLREKPNPKSPIFFVEIGLTERKKLA